MFDNNLLTLVLGSVVLYYVWQYLTENNIIKNDGDVVMSPTANEYMQQMPAIPTESNTQYVNRNPQVDDSLNAMPAMERQKNVHVATVSNDENLNLLKQNKNVLPFPQYSNNYTPLSTNNSVRASKVAQGGTPQDINKLDTSCSPHVDCYPKDTVTSQELLPREDPYNTWAQVNPDNEGHLADKNFLESGHHFGLNTVGSSLRNANQQLRSDPPIAQVPVGPWQQSTISSDTNRKSLEMGGDY
jgi:hypothetical protein